MTRGLALITQDDESGQYIVAEESMAMLANIPAPVAVVSIAGLWRTGKSYLLNHLSGANAAGEGFNVGATVNACTKGLWLWGSPLTLADGLTVLFVDTEGLGSTSRTQTEDSQIFSLALLLSSMFVWNSRGVIDGNALEDFALVVNLTKHIHVRSNAAGKAVSSCDAKASADGKEAPKAKFVAGGAGNSAAGGAGGHELDALAQHFPSFMWVVRDFTLRLEDGGRKINDRQYLENALKPQQSFTSEAASRNQIRTLLSSFFRERDCVTLVRPAEDEATLRNLSQVPLAELRPEFQAGLANLKAKIFAQMRAKSVNGRALSGAMLATLAKTYVDALNSGGVPTISTAWDRVLQSQAAEAMAEALARYDARAARALKLPAWTQGDAAKKPEQLLSAKAVPSADDDQGGALTIASIAAESTLPLESQQLRAVHDELSVECESLYLKQVWSDESQQVESSSREQSAHLDAALLGRAQRLHELNALASHQACAALLEHLCARLETRLAGVSVAFLEQGKAASFAEQLRAKLEEVPASEDEARRRAVYCRDLETRKEWLGVFDSGVASLAEEYSKLAVGPAKWPVFATVAVERLLAQLIGWATTLGVEHRAASKIARAECVALDEARQTSAGRLSASKQAMERELVSLERAAGDASQQSQRGVQVLESQIEARTTELGRHAEASKRLASAFDFATHLLDTQSALQRELFDDLKTGLAQLRDAAGTAHTGAADLAHADETWDAADLGFEREELAEFTMLSMPQLKERIAEDEKELELMHEHAALTIEHAKVKKMLLADKDHELQEYEYQWGVAKANVAASEGELMVLEEEVSVLRGAVLQMHRFLETNSRGAKFPTDLYKSLSKEQRALIDNLVAN